MTMDQRAWAIFAQDKWRVNQNLTFNLGLRYDLEFTPRRQLGATPTSPTIPTPTRSTRTTSRRASARPTRWDEGRSLLRSGWGLFYDKVNFGMVVDFDRNGIYSNSFAAQFPADRIDPGPRAGQMPDQPDAGQRPRRQPDPPRPAVPARSGGSQHGRGLARRPEPDMPSIQQISLGYQRQLGTRTSIAGRLRAHLRAPAVHGREPQPGRSDQRARDRADRPRQPGVRDQRLHALQRRRIRLRRAERAVREARVERVERARVLHAVLFARQHATASTPRRSSSSSSTT